MKCMYYGAPCLSPHSKWGNSPLAKRLFIWARALFSGFYEL